MNGSNLLPIISGNIGGSAEVQAAFLQARNAIIMAGQIQVDRVVSEAVMTMLMSWFNDRRSDWMAALNVTEQDAPNRPVASDRQLRMLAMHLYTKRTRRMLRKLYEGMDITLDLQPVSMLSIPERTEMLALLDQLLAARIITPEYHKRNAALLATD
jgi:hypothetical protein